MGGISVNLSAISFGTMLELIDKIESIDTTKSSTKQMLLVFSETIDRMLKEADEKIDDEWIKENIDAFQKMTLIDKVITPLMTDMNKTVDTSKKK